MTWGKTETICVLLATVVAMLLARGCLAEVRQDTSRRYRQCLDAGGQFIEDSCYRGTTTWVVAGDGSGGSVSDHRGMGSL